VTYAISLTLAARQEVIEAIDWYDAQVHGLGADFEDEADRIIRRIGDNPLQFQARRGGMRYAHLRRFPYHLVFITDAQTAFIIACFHSSRDPRLLKRRR